MSTPVNKTVNIYINQASAERALANLQQKAEKLNKSIERGRKEGKDMVEAIGKLDQTKAKITELTAVLDGRMAPSLRQMRSHAKDLHRELINMSEDAPGYAAKFREFEKVSASLQQMETRMRAVGRTIQTITPATNSFISNIKTIAVGTIVGNTVQAGLDKFMGYFTGIVSGNAKMSDSLANVKKATGLTADEVKRLNSELSKVNTRTKSEELREIAVGLGQIGEAANLKNIVNVDKIVVALQDEFGGGAKEITTVLGILRNNLQDIKTGNYGEDVLHIGNALNLLGAEGLATAPVITDFANRMAGEGETFGMTAGQILGISAAMQELGITPERGATAFNKIVKKITADVDQFATIAKYAGVSSQEFTELVNKDVTAAFMKVAEGAKIAGASNVNFGKIMKDLDTDGAGAGEVLAKIAQNAELVNEKVTLATKALKEDSSIIEEFNTKNNNLAATLEKIGRRMASWFTNGNMGRMIETIANQFARLIGAVNKTEEAFSDLEKQKKVVADLQNNVAPLISEYEELAKKAKAVGGESKLAKDEQDKLKTAFKGITEAIPLAITQFDQYGRAIGISTEKAKEFIKYQKLALQQKNASLIKSTRDDIAEAARQASGSKGAYESIPKQAADYQKKYPNSPHDWDGLMRQREAIFQEDLNKLRGLVATLAELEGKGIQEVLDSLPAPGANAVQRTLFGGFPKGFKRPLSPKDLLGDDFKATETPTAGDGTPEVTAPEVAYETEADKEKAKRLEEQRRSVLQQIAALKNEVLAMAKDETDTLKLNHEKQVADVVNKYSKIRQQALEYGVAVTELNELQAKEIDILINKQFDERSNAEYEQSLQHLDDFYNAERQKAGKQYSDGLVSYKAYQDKLKDIDRDQAEDRATITTDYAKSSIKAAQDTEKAKTDAVKKGVEDRKRIEAQGANAQLYDAERAVIISKAGTKANLDAKINLIKLTFDREIELARDNKAQQLLLEAEKNAAIDESRRQYLQYWVDQTMQALGTIQGVFSNYFNYLNQKDQQELGRDRHTNEQKKKNLKKSLDAKSISQAEYNRQVSKLDEDYAKKERESKRREFNRQKALNLVEATMNAAQAITSIWAVHAANPIMAGILTGIAGAATAIKIGTIVAQKFPEYKKGGRAGYTGVPDGPSHEEGGIDLVSNGRKIAEMEGGEPILSNETYRQNPELIDALLWAGQNNNGRLANPSFFPGRIDTAGIMRSAMYQPFYNNGGVAGNNTAAGLSGSGNAMSMILGKDLIDALNAFTEQIKQPVTAEVPFKKIQDAQRTYDGLKKAGSLARR